MALHCYRHPDTETVLRCGSCDRPICVRCVVHHPVGARFQECAGARKIPMFDVTPVYYARAIAAAVGIGAASVIALVVGGVLLLEVGIPGFYLRWGILVALVGLGHVMGTGVNRAVNRKRSRGLQWIAGVAVGVIYVATLSFYGPGLSDLFGVLALGFAIYVAVNKLRV